MMAFPAAAALIALSGAPTNGCACQAPRSVGAGARREAPVSATVIGLGILGFLAFVAIWADMREERR